MFVVCVSVWVKEGFEEAFIESTKNNHEGSITEPGCARFDVLRSSDEAGKFFLYEAYCDKAAAGAHKETSHYKTWRDTVADWMARPRVGVKHESLFPSDEIF